MPDVGQIVNMSMQRSDTNGDGKISADEIKAMNPQSQGRIKQADTNGDGDVTKAELTAAMKKAFSAAGAGGGGPR